MGQTNNLLSELLIFTLGQLATGAAIWGAIRADIKNMTVRISDIKETATYAHKRIDDILNGHKHERV